MLKTTLGQLLINEALPSDLRDYGRKMDKKSVASLMQIIAEKYPEQYKKIAKDLYDIGIDAATSSGGYSFGIEHLIPSEAVVNAKKQLSLDVDKILNSKISDKDKQKKIIETLQARSEELSKITYDEALKTNNPLALQVLSGARGNPTNLRTLLAGDLLYEDQQNNIIPIPILRSYSQGLSPVEYWAGAFGARKGVADVKFATQESGYFGKQLNQIAHRLVIQAKDSDKPYDSIRGIPVDTDDPDNVGAFLAHDLEGHKRNTLLTAKLLSELKAKGHDKILVRSPIVGGHPNGGVYSYDVGIRERGGLSAPGENVGISAASGIAEKISQGSLSSKHTGGISGAGSDQAGFKFINQVVQVPETYTAGATHADSDGKVSAIYPAPAGGTYVMIGAKKHFVSQGLTPSVKVGDVIEAGDVISNGLPNPAKIVEHKGIGEGRKYFVDIFKTVLKNSGINAHRRNLELLSRGLINHVIADEEIGDFMPDDVVPYHIIEQQWKPRAGFSTVTPKQAVGKYLESPVLHYSIGTPIKPSMVNQLERFGIKNINVHPEPPPFRTEMIRAMDSLLHDPDWMTRQLGTNLKKGLLGAAHRNLKSDETGSSFVPALARGVDFGRIGATKGWKPGDIVPLKDLTK